jgi:hypothetical protein
VKQCSWCNNYFAANVSYQIYCSSECRSDATKEKILERHRENRRKKRNDKPRLCAGKCGTKLSIYNDFNYCDNCFLKNKEINKKIKQIRMLFHDYEKDNNS